MPAYESYKDTNGVTWTVMSASNGWTMLASVLDSADPKYDPPPADEMVSIMPPNPMLPAGGIPTDEQRRVIFTGLRDKIETYAKAHRGAAVLRVTAKPPSGTFWVLLGAGLMLLHWGATERRRRR